MTLGELISKIEAAAGTSITDPALLGYELLIVDPDENSYDIFRVEADGRDNTVTLWTP